MAQKFTSIEEVKRAISSVVAGALEGPVQQAIKETESAHVATDVYAAYENKRYKRRGRFGDIENMQGTITELENGFRLEVDNMTPPNPKYWGPPSSNKTTVDKHLATVIETGEGYDYVPVPPRPFMENTAQELDKSGEIVDILAKALNKLGITVDK